MRRHKFLAAVAIYYSFMGCSVLEQHCQYMDLPGMACEASYSLVNDVNYYQVVSTRSTVPVGHVFIINDDSTYRANYTLGYPGLSAGTVDFTRHSVVGVNIRTNYGMSVKSQGQLCVYAGHNSWRYTVEYSLENQCAGSHIASIHLTATLVCPKMAQNSLITANIVDVNPF